MLLAAVSFVGINAGAGFDPRFIKQCQQRLAVMAIGGSRLNRYHQAIIIDYGMLLITKD